MNRLAYSIKTSPYVRDKREVERREKIQTALALAAMAILFFLNSLIPEL